MLHWIKPLWWGGIICSMASKQAFSNKPGKYLHGKIEGWNLHLKPEMLKASDKDWCWVWAPWPESALKVCLLWHPPEGSGKKQQCWQNSHMQECHLTAHKAVQQSCKDFIPTAFYLGSKRQRWELGVQELLSTVRTTNHDKFPHSYSTSPGMHRSQHPVSDRGQWKISSFIRSKNWCHHQELPQETQGGCSSLLELINSKKTVKYCCKSPLYPLEVHKALPAGEERV